MQFLEIKMIKNEAKTARHLREANNAFKAVRTEKPMTDYAKDQQSLHENRERLKAARLAREQRAPSLLFLPVPEKPEA